MICSLRRVTINNFRDRIRISKKLGRPGEERSVLKTICAMVLAAVVICVTPAFSASQAPPPGPPGENAQVYTDPLSPFNERMFWFNLRLDKYVVHPVASGYAKILPTPAREAAGRMFNNFDVLPRFANNLFQLHLARAVLRWRVLASTQRWASWGYGTWRITGLA